MLVSQRLSLTAVFRPVEDGWTEATIDEIHGVITAAPSLEEAKELLLDVLREYLLSFQEARPEIIDRATREPLEVLLGA